jgi:hypothetical protein
MPEIRHEVFSVTRACERLISTELTLTEDERNLLEYYMEELSREFFSDKPAVRLRFTDPPPMENRVT